jgi:TonB family protein
MITETDSKCLDKCEEGEISPAPRMFGNDLGGSSLPTRGLLGSVLVHGFLTLAFLFTQSSHWLPGRAHLTASQSSTHVHEVLLLPNLEPTGSDSAAAPSSSGESNKSEEDLASSYDAKAVQGVVYQGPQLIVSNSPHPDNFIQTIRQPDLAAKRELAAPLPIPPMVSIAPAKALLAPPAPQPAPDDAHENRPVVTAGPITLPPQQPRVEVPKLPLPASSSADNLLRAVANAAAPASMPKLAHQNPSAKIGVEARNILVVDAIPGPDRKPSAIPPAEIYGTFTVSPAGATAIGLAGGGVELKGAPGMANSTGVGANPYAGNGSKASGHAGEDKAVRSGVRPGTGVGPGGTEIGRGSSSSGRETGNGSGSGGVQVSGNGRGQGAGSGSSPFPSIMIQGGSGASSRSIARAPVAAPSKPQTNYGISILAGGGGGGFKDFGVFRNEASYTVFIDMTDTGASGSSWTLQYALDSRRSPNSLDSAPRPHGLLVPPYATLKSLPHFSPEAARRGRGGTMVVFGVINPQGKLEDLHVMQSPEAGLNRLLLDSLRKWSFQPAEIDGAHVPVKVLLGVPVDSVPGE